jgi:hypothetical protein
VSIGVTFQKSSSGTLGPRSSTWWTCGRFRENFTDGTPIANTRRGETLTTKQARDDAARRVERLAKPGTDIAIIDLTSLDFVAEMLRIGERLDAIYLDTDHLYDTTLKELHALRHC